MGSKIIEDIKELPIVEIAVGLNLIYDIIERVRTRTGVTITPDNIGQYVESRRERRAELNALLGVTEG